MPKKYKFLKVLSGVTIGVLGYSLVLIGLIGLVATVLFLMFLSAMLQESFWEHFIGVLLFYGDIPESIIFYLFVGTVLLGLYINVTGEKISTNAVEKKSNEI